MIHSASHFRITAPYQEDRKSSFHSLPEKRELWYSIDCHQNLGGPFTGTRALVRNIVSDFYPQHTEQIKSYAKALLSIAPELRSFVSDDKKTLTETASSEERLRFYGKSHSERLAQSLISFVLHMISLTAFPPHYLIFDNVHAADPLDQQVISALIRRTDPEQLSIVIYTTEVLLPVALQNALAQYTHPICANPLTKEECLLVAAEYQIPEKWTVSLLQHEAKWRGQWKAFGEQNNLLTVIEPAGTSLDESIRFFVMHCSTATQIALIQEIIQSAGTSDSILARCAYEIAAPTMRQRLHEEQARVLESSEPELWVLGALPYHHERGPFPAEAGVQALLYATHMCFEKGWYDGVIELGQRGRRLTDPVHQFQHYWEFTRDICYALSLLQRTSEAERLYMEIHSLTSDPLIHIRIAYAMGMIYTRFSPPNQRDHHIGKEWLQKALALIEQLPSGEQKAVTKAFHLNALALVETHLGKNQEALNLVQEAIDHMQFAVASNHHMLYRTVLLSNRGLLYSYTNHSDQALADFSAVIRLDPYYDDAYFNRAKLYYQLRQYEEALQDMTKGIEYGFPAVEIFISRANLLKLLERNEEAVVDYTKALDILPISTDALLHRAEIYYQQEQYQSALQDYTTGIAADNSSIELFYNRAHLLETLGYNEEALADYAAVLDIDPNSLLARLGRAMNFYAREKYEEALKEIVQGLRVDANYPRLLCLRGLIESAAQTNDQAYQTFTLALERDPLLVEAWTNRASVAYEMGQIDASIADLTHALTLEENSIILTNRAYAYQTQLCWDKAIADYTACLSLLMDDLEEYQEMLYQRAQCYLHRGETEKAVKDIKAHLALGNSPHQEELSTQLVQLS